MATISEDTGEETPLQVSPALYKTNKDKGCCFGCT